LADLIIENGAAVALAYTLRVDSYEGEVVEEVTSEEPIEFVFGEQSMLPMFENAIRGLTQGAAFKVSIPFAEAYGEEDEGAYVEIPKSEFIAEGEWDEELFAEGEVVPMNTPEGETLYGVVAEVKINSLVIDFNHPLAGEDLYFEGIVLKVSDSK
jgi:FKBP-type peptidyl-prolyl cis-trans isomerase SlyD